MRGFISQFNSFLFLGWVISWRDPLYDEFCLKLTIFTDKYPMHLCTHKANLIHRKNSNNNNNFPIFQCKPEALNSGERAVMITKSFENLMKAMNSVLKKKKKKNAHTQKLHIKFQEVLRTLKPVYNTYTLSPNRNP